MINIEHVREMCCNLQQQQLKISETYNELINSLKLEDKIEELNRELNSSKGVVQSLTNRANAQESEILRLKNELALRNGIIGDLNGQLEAKNTEISQLKGELENTKNVGNVILNLHSRQFRKLSKNIDGILFYLEYYNRNKRADLDRIYSTLEETRVEDMSSLQLLIEVNNKFVRLGINMMKLFSNLDYNLFHNYNSNSNAVKVGYTYPHFGLNYKKRVQPKPRFNSNYNLLVQRSKVVPNNPNKSPDQEKDSYTPIPVGSLFNTQDSDNSVNKNNRNNDSSVNNSSNFESEKVKGEEHEMEGDLDKSKENEAPNT